MIPRHTPKLIILGFVALTAFIVIDQLVTADAFAEVSDWEPLCILDWCQTHKPEIIVEPAVESVSLIGNIVTSNDGSTCWIVEEKIGVYYYRLLESCGDLSVEETIVSDIELDETLLIQSSLTSTKETHVTLEDGLKMVDNVE